MIPQISISFFLYHARKNKAEQVPIYYKLKLNTTGEERPFSTGFFINPDDWRNGAVTGRKQGAEINQYIKNLSLKIQKIQNIFIAKDEEFTLGDFIAELTGKSEQVKGFLKYFENYVAEIKKGVGKDYTDSTYKKWIFLCEHVKNFISLKYQKEDVPLKKLDYAFIEDFYSYMRNDLGHEPTTLYKEIQRVKQVAINAHKRQLIAFNPFSLFKNPEAVAETIYLNDEELGRLENKEFKIARLSHIRDLFIFSCYTGMAFAEISTFKKDSIEIGIDGKKWIVGYRQKTIKERIPFMIPLLPKAIEIIEKYKDDPRTSENENILPVPAGQTYNSYLKEIADLCEIEKDLTTHVARKTFGTTVTLSNDVPLHIVSEMLAHEDIRTTQKHYAKVVKKGISHSMEQLEQRLKLNKITLK